MEFGVQSGPWVVAVEGPNGAGKSLVANHLAEATGAAVVRYPQPFTDFRSKSRLDDVIPPLPRLAYYMAGIAHLSEEIASAGTPVVCDRYFASPLAYLLADRALEYEELEEVAAPILERIVIPEVTLLLSADHDTLRRRLESRGESRAGASMRRTLSSAAFTSSWLAHLRRIIALRGILVEIDTAGLDPRAVCLRAESAISDSTDAG